MIVGYTVAVIALSLAAGLFCLSAGLLGRTPSDYTVGASALLAVLLVVQIVIAIVSPFLGNVPSGDAVEFGIYLGTALLVAVGGPFWALVDRSRWSTVVLGVVGLTIAVMVYRMQIIWGW